MVNTWLSTNFLHTLVPLSSLLTHDSCHKVVYPTDGLWWTEERKGPCDWRKIERELKETLDTKS
jgi:hypothetical protein